MNTQPSIVVGFDGTPESVTALRWAVEEAGTRAVPLRIVHVWEQPATDGYVGMAPDVGAEEKALSWAEARVYEALGASALPDGSVVVARPGAAGPALVNEARQHVLLVLGTGVHRGLRRLVEGSVSHYCVAHAPVPVVTVPTVREALRETVPAGRPGPRAASGAFGPLL